MFYVPMFFLADNFSAIEVETAATFSARAALSIENAMAHEQQRQKIQFYEEGREVQKAA